MAGKKATSLLLICLILPYMMSAPAAQSKEKKQIFAVPIAIGLEELLTGALVAGGAAAAGASAIKLAQGIHSDHDSHACSGYSSKYRRIVDGWCRSPCFSHEIIAPNGGCGSYYCCIPNN